MTDSDLRDAARELLLVAHLCKYPPCPGFPAYSSEWWGDDTDCGTEDEILDEAVAILRRRLDTPDPP